MSDGPGPPSNTPLAGVLGSQQALNRASAGAWSAFQPHRARVTALLSAGAPGGGLCVLGAGNCNDLDLPALLAHHGRAVLVDLDLAALEAGAARQGLADDPRLRLHALDVTGVGDRLQGWAAGAPVTDDDLRACATGPARAIPPMLGERFAVVGSTCLLSQIIDAAAGALGETHPRFPDVLRSLRSGHLRLLAALAEVGGEAVLITDLLSSDTCPEIDTAPPADLPRILVAAIARRNFFSGLNPAVVLDAAHRDPALRLRGAELTEPWLWDLGPRRYAVYAVRMQAALARTATEPSLGRHARPLGLAPRLPGDE